MVDEKRMSEVALENEQLKRQVRAYRAALYLVASDAAFIRAEKLSAFFTTKERREGGPMLPIIDRNGEVFCCTYAELEEKGTPVVHVNCSDTFAWACADAEKLENLDEVVEVARIRYEDGWPGVVRWIAERRRERGKEHTPIASVQRDMDEHARIMAAWKMLPEDVRTAAMVAADATEEE